MWHAPSVLVREPYFLRVCEEVANLQDKRPLDVVLVLESPASDSQGGERTVAGGEK